MLYPRSLNNPGSTYFIFSAIKTTFKLLSENPKNFTCLTQILSRFGCMLKVHKYYHYFHLTNIYQGIGSEVLSFFCLYSMDREMWPGTNVPWWSSLQPDNAVVQQAVNIRKGLAILLKVFFVLFKLKILVPFYLLYSWLSAAANTAPDPKLE